MSEFLSPGVFIEEVSNAPQTVDAVGTSTMAIVGFTPQGPTDDAILVTGPDSYTRKFGAYTNQSLMALAVSAYFQNGGTRAYVVRVVPADAVAAAASITSAVSGEQLGGVQTGGTPVTVTGTLADAPLTAGTAIVTWKKAATAVTVENVVYTPAENGTLLGPFTGTLLSTPITNDTITIHWLESAAPKTATVTSAGVIGGANAANLSLVTLVHTTGAIAITFATSHPPDANSITVDYTPVGATATSTDNGSGAFAASGLVGTIDYVTGAVSLTFTGASIVPYNGSTVTMAYTGAIWGLSAISKGAWGSNLRVTLTGSPNFFTYGPSTTVGAGTYSKFDMTVLQLNSSGVYEVKETYEQMVVTDAADAMYLPDVINQGSDLISIVDHGFLGVPTTFNGVAHAAEVVGAGTGSLKVFSYTASNPALVKTSLVVRYTVGASPFTATANASGTITGTNLDATKTNTINWTTGLVTLNFSTAPDNATNVTMDYITMPTTTSVNYDLSGGSDGTVSTISNLQMSNYTALKSGKLGMYALDRVDEMMQLVIPDFAGDVTVQSDMVAYSEARRDVFSILSTPSGMTAEQAVDYQRITFNVKSKYAAMYWPWVNMADPLSANRTVLVPVVAHVAGVYARTDNNKNVGKAPGGTVDGALRGIKSLEFNPDKGDRDTVSPARINSLINTPQTGMAVWGVRSMSATNDAFKYINASRLFMFVEKSVFNSTHNYIFESINNNLFTNIKTQVSSFLLNLFNNAYFAGNSPAQAYAVKCDADNNPQASQDLGQVVCDVAIAPNKPGEFLRFRTSLKTIS